MIPMAIMPANELNVIAHLISLFIILGQKVYHLSTNYFKPIF